MNGTSYAPFTFIVGAPRSGTTLVRAILDSHPEFAIPGESHFIVPMLFNRKKYEANLRFALDDFLADLSDHPRFQAWKLPREEVLKTLRIGKPRNTAEAIRLVFQAYAKKHEKGRVGDKTPDYVQHIRFLDEMFPGSKFVHVIRDGRDVALSQFDVKWGPTTLTEAGFLWKKFVTAGIKQGRPLGAKSYLEIHYESLIQSPGQTARELSRFVGVAFDSQMLSYFERSDGIVDSFFDKSHQKSIFLPPTPGLRDWRRDMATEDVYRLESVAGKLLSSLNYGRYADTSLRSSFSLVRLRFALTSRRAVDRIIVKVLKVAGVAVPIPMKRLIRRGRRTLPARSSR